MPTPLTPDHLAELKADIAQALPIIQGLLASGDFTVDGEEDTDAFSIIKNHGDNWEKDGQRAKFTHVAVNEALDILHDLRLEAEVRLRDKHGYDA